MSVFRGDSDNGEVEGVQAARESGEAPASKVTPEAAPAPHGTAQAPHGTAPAPIEITPSAPPPAPAEPLPTPNAMRRTLARARDGKALDQDEATILLHARGDDLATLLQYAGRTRD